MAEIECPACKKKFPEDVIDELVSFFSGAEYGEHVYEAGTHDVHCPECGVHFIVYTMTVPTYHTRLL